MKYFGIAYVCIALLASCSDDKKQEIAESPRAESLLEETEVTDVWGQVIDFEPLSADDSARLILNIKSALDSLYKDTTEMNYIWLGRRLAYMRQYQPAIEVFSEGLEKFPQSFRLYRHRGHRYISIRKFDLAIADLEKAADLAEGKSSEVEPDGLPNKINTPLSNTHFNIYYHLGLAYYLKGEYEKAEQAYIQCMKYSGNPDLYTATADWIYMTYQRLGKQRESEALLATIDTTWKMIENDVYFNRLKLYMGLKDVEDFSLDKDAEDYALSVATQGYGIANYYLTEGDTASASRLMIELLGSDSKTAFGYIAAEADLKSLGMHPRP